MGKLPFVGKVFWTTLVIVGVLGVITWVASIKIWDYEMGPQDWGGSFICWILLTYLIHLWIIPAEDAFPEDEHYYDDPNESA